MDGAFRRDRQLSGSQLRYFVASTTDSDQTADLETACTAAGLQPVETEWLDDKPVEQRRMPPWTIVTACAAAGLPSAAVLAFALEGDNLPDAIHVAGAAVKAVPALAEVVKADQGWAQPPSWKHAFAAERVELGGY